MVRRAVRSEPAAGSVRANAETRSPLASLGRCSSFCSVLPKVRTGSTAPMQPWTDARPPIVGLDRSHLHQEPGECAEVAARAAVLRIDQQAPVANFAELVDRALGEFCFSRRRGCRFLRTALDDLDRLVASLHLGRRRRGLRMADKDVDREFLVPDCAVGRAAGGLILRSEQVLNLLVGPVEGSGLLGFFFARPPQLEGRFDEGRRLGRRARPTRAFADSWARHTFPPEANAPATSGSWVPQAPRSTRIASPRQNSHGTAGNVPLTICKSDRKNNVKRVEPGPIKKRKKRFPGLIASRSRR